MIDPKVFYRRIDSLLANIAGKHTGNDYLIETLKKFETSFAADLHIGKGRVYENMGSYFALVYPSSASGVTDELDAETPPMQALMKSGIYIFDDPAFTIDKAISVHNDYAIPAAFVISSLDSSWLFMFALTGGWVREEIDFCFNAIRRALNYKLFSEAVQSEFKQTAKIQQSLLPSERPQFEGYDIAVFSQAAELVGGDLYDFFNFDKNEFGFCVGDASGHGLPAALMVRDVVTGLRMGVEKHMKMVHTLKKLNEVIYRGSYSSSFISLFFGELEANGNLFYMNAGHPAPYLVTKETITSLPTTGMIVGAFPKMELHRSYVYMEENSVLVAFSDGITERINPDGEFFGSQRLITAVNEVLDKSADEIVKHLFSIVDTFGEGMKWEDDATILILKRLPVPPPPPPDPNDMIQEIIHNEG